jgi:hypothetical protein
VVVKPSSSSSTQTGSSGSHLSPITPSEAAAAASVLDCLDKVAESAIAIISIHDESTRETGDDAAGSLLYTCDYHGIALSHAATVLLRLSQTPLATLAPLCYSRRFPNGHRPRTSTTARFSESAAAYFSGSSSAGRVMMAMDVSAATHYIRLAIRALAQDRSESKFKKYLGKTVHDMAVAAGLAVDYGGGGGNSGVSASSPSAYPVEQQGQATGTLLEDRQLPTPTGVHDVQGHYVHTQVDKSAANNNIVTDVFASTSRSVTPFPASPFSMPVVPDKR